MNSPRLEARVTNLKNVAQPQALRLVRQKCEEGGGVIAPDASAAFVANMEDVLEVYQRPHDPLRPVVCLDETSKQMIVETRTPLPAAPGRKARHDYEYARNGVANLFMMHALGLDPRVRTSGRLAACESDRPSHRHRLCPSA